MKNKKSGFRKKGLTVLLLTFLFAVAIVMVPAAVFTVDTVSAAGNMIYWAIDADKNLTISDTEMAAPEGGKAGSFNASSPTAYHPWGNSIVSAKVSGTPSPGGMGYWFCYCQKLKTVDLGGIDMSKCTSMENMFAYCRNLKSVEFGEDADTSKCRNMSAMFAECTNITEIDISDFDMSSCETASYMFSSCDSLRKITMGEKYTNGHAEFPFFDEEHGAWRNVSTKEYYACSADIPYGAGTYEYTKESPSGYTAYYGLKGNMVEGFDVFVSPEKLAGSYVNKGTFCTLTDPWGWERMCYKDDVISITFLKGKNGEKVKYPQLSYPVAKGTNVSSASRTRGLFENYERLKKADLNGMDTAGCTNASYLFQTCRGLETVRMEELDLSALTNAENMFDSVYWLEMVMVGPSWQNGSLEKAASFFYEMYRADDGSYTAVPRKSTIPGYQDSDIGCNIYVSETGDTVKADVTAALAAMKKINALGKITSLDQKTAVAAARKAFDALTDDQERYIPAAVKEKLEAAEKKIAALADAAALKKGDSVTKGYLVYTVTDASKKTVSVRLTANGKNKAKTVKIASAVTIKGVACTVDAIPSKGFAGAKKLTKVTGGSALLTIGSKSFYKDKKLKKFKITSKKLNKIGSKSFYKCKKLKKIYLTKTTKLKKAAVKKSLKGSKVKTVKVKKSKKKAYRKIFTKKNCGRKVKVK